MRLSIGKRLLLGFFAIFIVELGIIGLGIISLRKLAFLNQRNLDLIEPMEATYELLLNFEKLLMPANDYLIHGNIMEKEIFNLQAGEAKKYIALVKEEFSSKKVIPEFVASIDEHFQRIEQMAGKIFQIEKVVGNMESALLMDELDAFTNKTLEAIEEYHEEYLDKQLSAGREEADKIMQEAMTLFLFFSFFALMLSIILSYLLARRVHRPIAILEKGCKKLSKERTGEEIEINTRDEFEDLAKSFNQMIKDLSHDENEIKKANEELSKWSQLLEARVEERTNELTVSMQEADERRRAIINMLEDINQARLDLARVNQELKETHARMLQSEKMAVVGQLASGVAHEINNPLTGILNNLQLVKMSSSVKNDFSIDEFNGLLGVIEESALRCKEITKSLLDFSHTSEGRFEPVSLNELAQKALIFIKYEMKIDNIGIKLELDPDIPNILADAQTLQQALLNIISNAKWAIGKRTEKDPGMVTIKTFYEKEKNTVWLYISDTGIGIPEENLSKLFEPFFTTKGIGQGTGLGLSVTYSIIKKHKGNIEVQSQLNKGTTFKISLPAVIKT